MDPDPSVDLGHVRLVVAFGCLVLLAWIPLARYLARRMKARLQRQSEIDEMDRQDRLVFHARNRPQWATKVPENTEHVDNAFQKPRP